jgi:D-alanine--poly(phosphoribitol) ligase subunit 1
MIGAVLAGSTYAPIDPAGPPGRAKRIIETYRPDVIVTEQSMVQNWRPWAGSVITPEEVKTVRAIYEPTSFKDHIAYVIFTSGSTGKPKGVQVRRSSLSWFIAAMDGIVQTSPMDRWAQQPNLGFDLSIFDIWCCLSGGATLVPVDSDLARLFPGRFIQEKRISIWQSVPSVMKLIMRAGDMTPERLSSLRLASFCGEPLLVDIVRALRAAAPSCTILNTYGPTETTVFCFVHKIDPLDAISASEPTLPIGMPLDGVECRLEPSEGPDREMVIWGEGVKESYIGGSAPGNRGYRQRSDQSLEYWTGDLISRRNEQLYFAGRHDEQVKVLGHRLELAEVEHVALEAGFSEAAAVVVAEKVVLCVEGIDQSQIDSLLWKLRDELPAAVVPVRIIPVQRIPRNANDKIDRQLLKELI